MYAAEAIAGTATFMGAMEPRILFLHIGTHKTGTTSLQAMVAAHPAHFESQGLYYPRTGRAGWGHHNIAWQLTGDERFDPRAGTLADLLDELRTADPSAVLVSSEDFEYLYRAPGQLSRLRRALDDLGYAVRIVVTLRRQSDYVESLYAELLKHGLKADLDTFVSDALAQGGVSHGTWEFRLIYDQLLDAFADVFGEDSVRAIPYDPDDSAGPLLRHCGELIGRPLSPVTAPERLNAREVPARSSLNAQQRRSLDGALRCDEEFATT